MGVLFITHDIGVVAEIADRVVVMKAGRIVESGKTAQILEAPQADYTRMLIAAVPTLDVDPHAARLGYRSRSEGGAHCEDLPLSAALFRGNRTVQALQRDVLHCSVAGKRWASSENPVRESRRWRDA